MAIGDSVVFQLGTAADSHQPASGVEVQIMSIFKPGATDPVVMDDGSITAAILVPAIKTAQIQGDAAAPNTEPHNVAIMIDNGFFITKQGTTDNVVFCGVQTNA